MEPFAPRAALHMDSGSLLGVYSVSQGYQFQPHRVTGRSGELGVVTASETRTGLAKEDCFVI
jgi:hypothetical protein